MSYERPQELSKDPQYWEAILAKEGMPAKLPYNVAFTPELQQKYSQVKCELENEGMHEPRSAEIAAHLKGDAESARVVRLFGERVVWLDEHMTQMPYLAGHEDQIMWRAARTYIDRLIGTDKKRGILTHTERGIIVLRYGLESPVNEGHIAREVGKVYGLGLQDVYRREARALRRIRQAAKHIHGLRDFLIEPGDHIDSSPVPAKRDGWLIFNALQVNVPVVDTTDARPYLTRLSENCDTAARDWLHESAEQLREFAMRGLESPHIIHKLARSVIPPAEMKNSNYKFDLNTLRARILLSQRNMISSFLEELYIAKRRVSERPLHPAASDARAASLLVIDTQITAFAHLARVMDGYVLAYTQASHAAGSALKKV